MNTSLTEIANSLSTSVLTRYKPNYIMALSCLREQESLQPFRDFMAAHHAQNLMKMMDEHLTSSEHLPNLAEGKSNQKILEAILK